MTRSRTSIDPIIIPMVFLIGLLLVIGAVISWFSFRPALRKAVLEGREGSAKLARLMVSGALGLGGLAAILASVIVIIQPGQVGVQVLFGHALPDILTEGIHIVNPFVQVYRMSVRTQEYTMSVIEEEGQVKRDDSIDALTKDGLTVKLDVTVWFRLNPQDAVRVFRTIGPNYVSIVVRPAIRTALRDAATYFNAVDIYSEKRQEFVALAEKEMKEAIEPRGIIIERVLLRNVSLPEKVKQAIEEKLAAEQEAQKMQFVLEKERLEAERKRVEAQGLADTQRIINKTLTPQYLQYLYLTSLQKLAESQNTTFLIAPYDKNFLPLLNIGGR